MGAAKLKRRRKEAFLKQHPYCCYCGGETPTTTVDHIPSRQMFSQRWRPKGLEVPACDTCNRATRQHEQVAAMLGRVYPDGPTEAECSEVERTMRAVKNNSPGLLEEMLPSREQEMRFARSGIDIPGGGGVLNCDGPLLNHSIQMFGAKLGFALHYGVNDRIVPLEGGVAVRWFSNYDAATDGIPQPILRLLGERQTLRQGKRSVDDQFTYAYAVAEGGEMAIYFSTFRMSFAVLSWVSEDMAGFEGVDNVDMQRVHRTGGFTAPPLVTLAL